MALDKLQMNYYWYLIYCYNQSKKCYFSYIAGGQLFFNTYFKGQGFPKAAMFDPSRPVETISAFVNYAAKKYFDVKINSKEYVKPAVMYIMVRK